MHWGYLLLIWAGITLTFGLLNVWLVPLWRYVEGTYNKAIWGRLLADGGLLFWGVALLSSALFAEIHAAPKVVEDISNGKWGTFSLLFVADFLGVFFAFAAVGVAAIITQRPAIAAVIPGGQPGARPAGQLSRVVYVSIMLGLLLFSCSAVVTGALLARG